MTDVLAPGLRLGYVIAPAALRAKLVQAKLGIPRAALAEAPPAA